jgi:hypothetical protein
MQMFAGEHSDARDDAHALKRFDGTIAGAVESSRNTDEW